MPDPLPRREADMLNWSANFRNHIAADYELLGLTSQQATDYSILHDEFAEQFRRTRDPGAAAPTAFVAKRGALKSLKKMARQLSSIIRGQQQVDDSQRIALGLKKRRRGRGTPVARPREAPWMHIVSVAAGVARVRLFDRERPTNKGKPRGVGGIVVHRYVGEHPPSNLKEWTFARLASRVKFEVRIPTDVPPEASVWLAAQWMNGKGQTGPACSPVNLRLGYALAPLRRLAA